jgi:hypothetical protein
VSKVGKLDELIRQEKHPAVQLVLRALLHVRDKIEDGADVDVIYNDNYDYIAIVTKKGRLVIKRVEIDNIDKVKVIFIRINKHYCEGSKVTLKQYLINYNKELLTSLIHHIDIIVEEAVIDGVNKIDESIDDVVSILKALTH